MHPDRRVPHRASRDRPDPRAPAALALPRPPPPDPATAPGHRPPRPFGASRARPRLGIGSSGGIGRPARGPGAPRGPASPAWHTPAHPPPLPVAPPPNPPRLPGRLIAPAVLSVGRFEFLFRTPEAAGLNLATRRGYAYYASMSQDPLLGTFEQLVLAAIVQVGDGAYPPPVLARIEQSTGRAVNRGSFYVSLDRLERKGLLRSRPEGASAGRGGRPRRYLEITPEGLAALRHARDSLLASWTGIEALLGEKP